MGVNDLSYVFTIFFLTLGPLKTIPAFFALTKDLDTASQQKLAVRATVFATVIVIFIALASGLLLQKWKVSLPALQVAGGILLFISAARTTLTFGTAPKSAHPAAPTNNVATPPEMEEHVKALALSPMAVPTIITPFGVVAIMLFAGVAKGDPSLQMGVYGLLVLMMVLNLLGMLFAHPIMRSVGIAPFAILGWIFSVLQAGLAMQAVIGGLHRLGIVYAP